MRLLGLTYSAAATLGTVSDRGFILNGTIGTPCYLMHTYFTMCKRKPRYQCNSQQHHSIKSVRS
jgi:hypothetical protein